MFPLPMDLLKPLLDGGHDGEVSDDRPARPSDEPKALPPSG